MPSPLIGRDRELTKLTQALALARKGEGGLVFVSGEGGVGLTRLAEEALARSDFAVLAGRAREDATPAYGPMATALRACLRSNPDLADECGPLASHLAVLMPEMGDAPPSASPGTLIEAIAGALAAKTRRHPTAVFLDDLQWADHATLELLPELDDRLGTERLIILATYHTDGIGRDHPLRRLRHSLRRARRWREVPVGPLDPDQTRSLVTRLLNAEPTAELADLIHAQTQGFPLYIEELTSALISRRRLRPEGDRIAVVPGDSVPIPESIRDAVLLKLDGLSEDARRLIEVAAVAGTEFDLEMVCRLAGGEQGLDELFASSLVAEPEPGRGAFRHAIMREAVRGEITWSRRRALHRSIAAAAESAGLSPEIVAEHWLEAREDAPARRALLASAERSCKLHAYRDAARAAGRALEVWPDDEEIEARLDALAQLAHCAQVSGQLGDAVRALREMADHPSLAADPARRAEALRSLATVHQLEGAWEQSVQVRRAAAKAFAEAGQPAEEALEWLALGGRYTAALLYDSALDAVRTAVILAEKTQRWDIKARALGLEGNLKAMQGEFDAGRNLVNAGLSLALEHRLTEAAAEVYRRLGSVLEFGSNYAGARDAYFTAFDYCRTQGVDTAAQTCLGCLSYIVYRTGEWKRTLEVCREILAPEEAPPGARGIADGVSGLVRAQRGEVKQARRLLQSSLDISRRQELTAMELCALYGLAIVSENEGDAAAAESGYRQLIERWRQTEDRHDIIPWLCWAATFFAERGDERMTATCAEELASIAAATGNPEALAGLAYALGEVTLLEKKPAEAGKQFDIAILHMEKLDAPLEQSLALYRTGVAKRRAGDGKEAVRHLTSAYHLARKLGARPLAARIARELEELGERVEEGRHPEARARETRGGLTRRQVEILELMSTGLSNKEIADRLYLSPRTVDMHVGHVLDRLDCRSRTEAVGKARDLGVIS